MKSASGTSISWISMLRLLRRETMRFRQSLSSTFIRFKVLILKAPRSFWEFRLEMRLSMRSKGTHWLKK